MYMLTVSPKTLISIANSLFDDAGLELLADCCAASSGLIRTHHYKHAVVQNMYKDKFVHFMVSLSSSYWSTIVKLHSTYTRICAMTLISINNSPFNDAALKLPVTCCTASGLTSKNHS